jgi:hypothetical protein
MEVDMLDITTLAYLGGVALITSMVQVIKKWVKDDAFYPLISMAFGVVLNLAIALIKATDIATAVFMGVLAGLTASGIYSIGGTGEKK